MACADETDGGLWLVSESADGVRSLWGVFVIAWREQPAVRTANAMKIVSFMGSTHIEDTEPAHNGHGQQFLVGPDEGGQGIPRG